MANKETIDAKKLTYLIVGVMLVALLVTGATYAYLISTIAVYNGVYEEETTCFDIIYDATNEDGTIDLTGDLTPSAEPTGGLNGTLTVGLSSACNLKATGYINFYVEDMDFNNNSSMILTQILVPHCENSKTLETLDEYSTLDECTAQTDAIWVEDGTALKYAVYEGVDTTNDPISVGYVDTYGTFIQLHSVPIDATSLNDTDEDTTKSFSIYIWLDADLVDSNYSNLSFEGNIYTTVIQEET